MHIETCVEKILNGEKDYFRILVQQMQGPIYTLAVRMTGDVDTASDLTQDIFLKVYKNLPSYNYSVKITTWIYTIATNTCIDYLRKKKDLLLFDQQRQTEIPQQLYDLPGQTLENQELRQHIYKKIESLPEHYRIVIILKYINELSFEEIATILNQPLSSVKTKCYRGKDLLRTLLNDIWIERGK